MALSLFLPALAHPQSADPWACKDPTAATFPGPAPRACQDAGEMLPCMGIQLTRHCALTCPGLPW